jgi:hypothetical protein
VNTIEIKRLQIVLDKQQLDEQRSLHVEFPPVLNLISMHETN